MEYTMLDDLAIILICELCFYEEFEDLAFFDTKRENLL